MTSPREKHIKAMNLAAEGRELAEFFPKTNLFARLLRYMADIVEEDARVEARKTYDP